MDNIGEMNERARKMGSILALLNDPRNRERMLQAMNRENTNDVGPFAGDKGEKFLSELNEMQDLEGEAGRKENPDRVGGSLSRLR